MNSQNVTAVGKYIDLYREHCGTEPTLSNSECAVINGLAKWAKSGGPSDADARAKNLESALHAYRKDAYLWRDLVLLHPMDVAMIFSGAPDNKTLLKTLAAMIESKRIATDRSST